MNSKKAILPYEKLRILMAGGGTGGHLYPAVAIAEAFLSKNAGSDILFVSTGNALEKKVLAQHSFALACITAEGVKGRGWWHQLRAILRIPVGVWQSWRILKKFLPDMVIGVGGYASGPMVLAAWLRRIPVGLQEQNLLPGITNRMAFRLAGRVYVSFPDTRFQGNLLKIRYVGNPVRRQFIDTPREAVPEISSQASGHGDRPFTIAIIGGSQGAHAINLTITDMLKMLPDRNRFHFIHQTGDRDFPMVQEAYRRHDVSAVVQPFFENMAECYHAADLLICRSGATTIAEIAAAGKPAILIPYPYAADNHQALNAMGLVRAHAAEVIPEAELSPQALAEKIHGVMLHPADLRLMAENARRAGKPFAAEHIVEDCYAFLGRTIHPES